MPPTTSVPSPSPPGPAAAPAAARADRSARPRRRLLGSISAKIALTTVLLLSLVLAAFLAIVVRTLDTVGQSEADARVAAVEKALHRLAASLARNSASAAEPALFDSNFTYLQALVERAAAGEQSIRFVQVLDDEGLVLADSRGAPGGGRARVGDELSRRVRTQGRGQVLSAPDPTRPAVSHFATPILAPAGSGQTGAAAHLGQLRVGIGMDELARERAAALAAVRRTVSAAVQAMAVAAGLLLLLGISVAVAQGMRLSRPLSRLAELAGRIAGGELDQRVPVGGATEIARLSAEFNFMAGRIGELLEQTRWKATVEKELEVARVVQEALVPTAALRLVGSVQLAARYRPAAACGGDWWTARRLDDARVLVAIGDVSGHGLPAALIMAAALGCCETQPLDAEPEAILRHLNEAVLRAGQGRFFMSCFVSVIDRARGHVRFANAGHTFPFVARRDAAGAWDIGSLAARGSLLGNDRDLSLTTGEQPLGAGDLVCWFSDGLTERRSPAGEPWGERRLAAALRRGLAAADAGSGGGCERVRDAIAAAVDGFAGPAVADDDLTVVVGEVAAPARAVAVGAGV